MLIQVIIQGTAMLIAIFMQTLHPLDLLVDTCNLFMLGTLLLKYPLAIVGVCVFVWLREHLKEHPKPTEMPVVPQNIFVEYLNTQSATMPVPDQQALQPVQVFDYVTGESQYAFLQPANKSLFSQMGVSLKRTILLERGRPQDLSGLPSRLLSHMEHQTKPQHHNLQIQYETEGEFQKNQRHSRSPSIPFKAEDFDQQMGEIAEIESNNNEKNQTEKTIGASYDHIPMLLLLGAITPTITNEILQLSCIFAWAVVYQSKIYRRETTLTCSYLVYLLVSVCTSVAAFALSSFVDIQDLLWGGLLVSLMNTNCNLQILAMGMPLLLNIIF